MHHRTLHHRFHLNLNLEPIVKFTFDARKVANALVVAYGYSTDVVGFIVERISGLTLEQYWYAAHLVTHSSFSQCLLDSQQNLFIPLEIESASFYLTEADRTPRLSFVEESRQDHNPMGRSVPFNRIQSHKGSVNSPTSPSDVLCLHVPVHVHLAGITFYASQKDYLKVPCHLQISGM